jgi:hypothetical protein
MKSWRMALLLVGAIGTTITSVPQIRCACPASVSDENSPRQVESLQLCCAHGCCGLTCSQGNLDSSSPCCRNNTQHAGPADQESEAPSYVPSPLTMSLYIALAPCFRLVHTPTPITTEKPVLQTWQSWIKFTYHLSICQCSIVEADSSVSDLKFSRAAHHSSLLSTDLVSLQQRLTI